MAKKEITGYVKLQIQEHVWLDSGSLMTAGQQVQILVD